MASGELNSHYYAKILAIIRNQNLQNSKQTISQKNFWPAARPSLQTLSNINLLCSKNKVQPKEKAKYQKNKPQRRFTQNMRCKSAVLQFVRPATCNAEPRRSHKNQVKTVKSSDINLFEMVRNQALVKLKTQKQDLMKNIFDQKRIEIHRVNEDEEIMTKENAINFKTYNALNKMMNIQDRIYQTLNYRPKTGESTNKRRLCIH